MKTEKKKFSPLLLWVGIIFLAGIVQSASESREVFVVLIGMLIILTPPVLLIWMIVLMAKKRKPAAHTHDRIDHRTDLRVDPKTGKVQRTTIHVEQHTPQEHWKQQLDGLLANGTIDRAEYRALLNHRF